MKKVICICLVFIFVFSSAYASAASGYIYCWNCGTKIAVGCNYCPSCGAQQNGTAGTSSASASTGNSSYSTGSMGTSYYVGDTVLFGRYEQDNVSFNGVEDIQWIVLDVDKTNRKILLISKYGLDNVRYNSVEDSVTWDVCSLRSWLNTTFLNNAFTYTEQNAIADTYVSAQLNPEYRGKDPGEDTVDKIFILSVGEADHYLTSDSLCRCAATAYAEAQGVTNYYEEHGNCWWWLRNPGYYHNRAVHAYDDGTWNYDGTAVHRGGLSVRPVMWVYY